MTDVSHGARGDVRPPRDDLDVLLDHLGDPRRWTWVLDFDGTLAPIVDHPDDAVAAPGAAAAVTALAEVCEVALLSGRALDDLVERLGTVPPRVLLVGGHGSEARLPDGTRTALTDLDAACGALADVAHDLARVVDPATGWLVERKSTSIAVHHRRVADDEVASRLPAVRALLEAAGDRPPGFVLLEGKAVLELKARGVDKGRALAWIHAVSADEATALPGAPTIRPLVLGDDVTDEDGFEAAVAVGGTGVLIATDPTATAARFRLHDPPRVVTLLEAVRRSLGPHAHAGPGGPRWQEAHDAVAAPEDRR